MKFAASFAIAALAAAVAAPASAQFAKPEDAVKYRQSVMFVMSQHVARIGAMVNGKAPYDAKVAADNAALVAEFAKLPWPGFVAGTDKIGNTKAKPEIWTDQAKFKETNEKLVAETEKLSAAAKTNNLDNLKAAFSSTADTCKSCHDTFRNK
ncbi:MULTISPECIES: c-type cytochrome [Ramlibacter]|uniref:Cytochrome c n=1 Tax=Ramlibacter pinisoli TaxID=2682844 RepID=A0A6N8IMM9_9BURK|nr:MULTISPECIES: cytochrome c [Ramlibacter]MBA2963138.1 cytochrome c [Ramlibacter sp. CGMCC 1.13660]MVQ28107.1 cytochrome c [Ramlibacter pinisoli]